MSDSAVTVRIPGNHLMGPLLGEHDRHLRSIEGAFPTTKVMVRGNEITIDGEDAATVGTVFAELVVLIEHGHRIDERTIERTVEMVRADERPSTVLTHETREDHRVRANRSRAPRQSE